MSSENAYPMTVGAVIDAELARRVTREEQTRVDRLNFVLGLPPRMLEIVLKTNGFNVVTDKQKAVLDLVAVSKIETDPDGEPCFEDCVQEEQICYAELDRRKNEV